MKKLILILVVAIAAIAGYFYYSQKEKDNPEQVFCTMEAKLCPDGSYVGRTGPKCEFTACPPPSATSVTLQAALLGQKVEGLNVALTPLEVTEDSRCPADVQCVWAGTVKVRTKIKSGLGESIMIFEPNKPITTEVEAITLKEIAPAPRSGQLIPASSYRFVFDVAKR